MRRSNLNGWFLGTLWIYFFYLFGIFQHPVPFYFIGQKWFSISETNYGNLPYLPGGSTPSQVQHQIMNEVLQSYPFIEQKIVLLEYSLINSFILFYSVTALVILFSVLTFRNVLKKRRIPIPA